MMTAEKKGKERVQEYTAADVEGLYNEVAELKDTVKTLIDLLTTDKPRAAKAEKKTGRRAAFLPTGDATTAHRARVGKAAKASGYTFAEWVATYGMRTAKLTKDELHAKRSTEDSRQAGLFEPKRRRRPKSK